MATQKGTKGAVFGIPATTTLTFGSTTFNVVRTYNYSREADTKEIRDADGDVINYTSYNARERCTVDIIVDGATLAAALAAFNVLPSIGDAVQITSTAADTQIHSTSLVALEWTVESASKVATQDDFGTMSLALLRWATELNAVT